jgi:tRNA-modifying protein YgfZ
MTPQIDDQTTTIYNLAHQEAILVDRSELGMLYITGESRLDLLHRMSTQAVKGLQSGQGAATVLTSDIARIIDRLILYAGSQSVYALTGEGNADAVARYLMRFVFFNDDFHMKDISGETAVLAIYGPQAAAKLTEAGFSDVDLPLHHWREEKLDGASLYLHRADPVCGDGYFITCNLADKEAALARLTAANLPLAAPDQFEMLRVESGLPRFGRELTRDYIPLEANLWDDVSFTKGCYIGQEIIARMESRGRLAKKLVRLTADQPLTIGATITANGKTGGAVTSAAVTPHAAVALGYVKTAALTAESQLNVDGIPVRATERSAQ